MNIFKHIYNTIFNKNKICIDCNTKFSNNNRKGVNHFDNYTLKNICKNCSDNFNDNKYNLTKLSKYINKYNNDKNINTTIGICWKCKNIFENFHLNSIHCMNRMINSKCPVLNLCKKCNNTYGQNISLDEINTFNTKWIDDFILECIKNKINMNKDIIKKHNIIYYKKIYLYHCIVFDYRTIDEKYNPYYKLTLKRLDIKTICDCCFSEFVNNNLIL